MSKGVLIFAQNNTEIDYVKIAIFAAERVKQYVCDSVCLITDTGDYIKSFSEQAKVFEHVINIDSGSLQNRQFYDGAMASKTLHWKNFSRSDCYDLSPYDETLVIDSDFIINSNTLSNIWGSPEDFLIYENGYDLAQWRGANAYQYINQYSIPFYWATVFYFRKTEYTRSLFTIIKHIKDNWDYYRLVYSIETSTFRNDYAFSIAIHLMNNQVKDNLQPVLPGKLFYTLDRDLLVKSTDQKMLFLIEKEKYHGEYTAVKTNGLDIHIMNKYSLARYIDEQ